MSVLSSMMIIISGKEGGGTFIKELPTDMLVVLHNLHIINGKLQPYSNVLRIHVQYIMKRKPHLNDGTVTVDTSKNRLVEIPPSGCEPQMLDRVNTSNTTIKIKER